MQFLTAIVPHVFVLKGLKKRGQDAGLRLWSLRFPCLDMSDVETFTRMRQTWEQNLKISSNHDIYEMKILEHQVLLSLIITPKLNI
jgi:hypothetical protein